MRSSPHAIVNVAAALVCSSLVIALLVPVVAQQRSEARSSVCAMHLKQLGLAIHNYHSAYKQLPPGCGGTNSGDRPEQSNQGRLGPLVALLPFAEQQSLWERISNPYTDPETNQRFPPMGPVPWHDANLYEPWGRSPSVYRCPDQSSARPVEPQKIVYTLKGDLSRSGLITNYVTCYGDGTFNVGSPWNGTPESATHARATKRGMFQAGMVVRFRDCLDGLSNTLMLSETRSSLHGDSDGSAIFKNIVGLSKNPSRCLSQRDRALERWDFGRGSRWCDGALALSGFQAVLPPNSPSCTSELGIEDAIVSASSDHPGGVYVLFADGRVAFASDQIDSGNSNAPGISSADGYGRPGDTSPYGLWGALGSRASREPIEDLDGIEDAVSSARLGPARKEIEEKIWKSRTGDVTLKARFVRIIDQEVIELEDANGVLHQVPLNTLCDEDIFNAVRSELLNDAPIEQ